ncbi:aminoglycoside 6-adenylyltransferase [Blautia sp. RD014234]|nr:aminoglycoside 6-adenylyltransferase [Blautia parvula]
MAKGMVRDQMPYAWRMYHQVVHVELEKMAEWYIAAEHVFPFPQGCRRKGL